MVLGDRALQGIASQHRAVAEAALEVLSGDTATIVHARRLEHLGIPIEMLDQFLRVTESPEKVREFLTRDLVADIRNDLEQQVRRELKRERLAMHLMSQSKTDQDKFWSDVLKASRTVILDNSFVQPDLKGVLDHHENLSTGTQ